MTKPITSILHPIAIDPGFGELAIEPNYSAHVEQLIKQVLFTNPGERINRIDFGCGIRRMVFAPNSQVSASLAQVTVFQALEKWLANVIKVDKVEINVVEETLEINIAYVLIARRERRFLNLEVTL